MTSKESLQLISEELESKSNLVWNAKIDIIKQDLARLEKYDAVLNSVKNKDESLYPHFIVKPLSTDFHGIYDNHIRDKELLKIFKMLFKIELLKLDSNLNDITDSKQYISYSLGEENYQTVKEWLSND